MSRDDVFDRQGLHITPGGDGHGSQIFDGSDILGFQSMSIKQPPVIGYIAIGMVDQPAKTFVLKVHKLLPSDMRMPQHGIERRPSVGK
jgi:hypothetical protein